MAIIRGSKLFPRTCSAGIRRIDVNPSYGLTFWLNRQAPNARRNRHREGTRPQMAAGTLDWRLPLPGGAGRHGRRAWLKL